MSIDRPTNWQTCCILAGSDAEMTNKRFLVKLSPAQNEVMKWLGQGWEATHTCGSVFEVNGKRICNYPTMKALLTLGLVKQETRWV